MIGVVRAEPRRIGIGFWLSVTLAAATLAPLIGSTNAAARPLDTGITIIGETDPLAFQQARATGATFARVALSWEKVAPPSQPANWHPEDPADPNYDWTAPDLAISRTLEAGLTPVVMIYEAPSWAEGCQAPASDGESVCDPSPSALAAFASAAARRYNGDFAGLPRVRYWQGLNEPNLSLYFNPQFQGGKPVSADLYRTLINSFYSAIKSVNPSNLVLAGGLGPIGIPNQTVAPLRFTRLLLCMKGRHNPHPSGGKCGGGVHFDIFDIHPYTTGGPTHRGGVDDVEMGDLGKLAGLIRAADRAGRIKGRYRHTPIWDTEFSWDSKPPDPGGVPMRILERWTSEAAYLSWKAGITRFFWLCLRDFAREPGLPFSQTIEAGLYFRGATVAEDRPKPMMYAFRFPFVAYSAKDGFSFWGRTPSSSGGKVVIEIQRGGKWRKAAVTRADKSGIFDGIVRGAYGRHKHGTVRARFRRERAIPFSLHPVKDFYQPPFG